jgi:hypothetical protein
MSAEGCGSDGGAEGEREKRTIRGLHDRRAADRFLPVGLCEEYVSDKMGEPQHLEGYPSTTYAEYAAIDHRAMSILTQSRAAPEKHPHPAAKLTI